MPFNDGRETMKTTESSGLPHGSLLSTGDLARACKTTVRTVRFYEEEGLIKPLLRSEGGHRLYGPAQASRLALIIELREAGMSLHEIKELLELKRSSSTPSDASERLSAMLERQIADVGAKVEMLQRLLEELMKTMSIIKECKPCQRGAFPNCCSECAVMQRKDLPRAMKLIWG
ncbi:MAG: MerR family transcriptional regulator [Sandaracinaceae bacterium]|nr:MerR family transcriptional regulator [Sandaracinaceae bacterium]MDW8247352.1 MerR family transcriptional regulator [Sandaracinaceae bacterium]